MKVKVTRLSKDNYQVAVMAPRGLPVPARAALGLTLKEVKPVAATLYDEQEQAVEQWKREGSLQ